MKELDDVKAGAALLHNTAREVALAASQKRQEALDIKARRSSRAGAWDALVS